LRQSVKNKPVSFPDVPNASAMLNSLLDSSEKSLDAGWLHLSLEQLGQASEALEGPRAMPDKNDASKSSVAGFEAKWERVSRDVAALDQKTRERNWDNAPAALRAISEAAQATALPLVESGQGFATAPPQKTKEVVSGTATSDELLARLETWVEKDKDFALQAAIQGYDGYHIRCPGTMEGTADEAEHKIAYGGLNDSVVVHVRDGLTCVSCLHKSCNAEAEPGKTMSRDLME